MPKSDYPVIEVARCFLPSQSSHLPARPACFSLSEAILWRQAGQILFALDALDRPNYKIEGAVSVSITGKRGAMTVELGERRSKHARPADMLIAIAYPRER